MIPNSQTTIAHKAAEQAAKEFGYSGYAELNESGNEPAKQAARAAFDKAFTNYPAKSVILTQLKKLKPTLDTSSK
ncbi:hypothetical protein B4P00_21255 [Shewanella xiamenensis]|jgi:hypothetical protein|uniref:hypothetical protein n=1 Tax=Shewanella xiamenensis TaxID=332186 RepID=UPI001C4E1DA2|nr:hypothetical protein [Shewanella xiamenensis]MBW0298701.1 hypothetical protein [Shewanella xiamenensis]